MPKNYCKVFSNPTVNGRENRKTMNHPSSIEKYINKNRDEFDQVVHPPRDRMWEAISSEQGKTHPWKIQLGRNWRWSIAAAILLALSVGWWVQRQPQPPEPGLQNLAHYFPELADEEARYQALISNQETMLEIDKLDKTLYRDIFNELKELEKIHRDYLADVPAYQEQELLVRTLIKYYERKLRILERLSYEIEKQKIHENRTHEILQ